MKMKKCLSLVLAAAMTFTLASCGGSGGGEGGESKVSLNVSVPDADNSYIYAAAQEFKSRVEEYSNGSIELETAENSV